MLGRVPEPFARGVVILMPPLGIAEPELRQLVDAVHHGLDEVYR